MEQNVGRSVKDKIIYLAGCLGLDVDIRDSLIEMLKSSDIKDFNMGQGLISNFVAERNSSMLNECQKKAFDEIVEYLDTNENEYGGIVLKGYAGTGKTFLIGKIISWYTTMYPSKHISMTAPTNKAVNVLYNSRVRSFYEDEMNIEYITIHKLLGIKEVIDDEGNVSFVESMLNSMTKTDVIIIDETSMLPDKLCNLLWKYDKKLIFIGDPLQIPPVNMKDSIPFRDPESANLKVLELDKIMRQAEGNPIIGKSIQIREHINDEYPIKRRNSEIINGTGVVYLRDYGNEVTSQVLRTYFSCDKYKNDKNWMKVISWTNAMVRYYNNAVRNILYPNSRERFMPGELLVAEDILRDSTKFRTMAFTSEEFIVKESYVADNHVKDGDFEIQLPFYFINACSLMTGKNLTLTVVHEDYYEEFKKIMSGYRSTCAKVKNKELWKNFFNVYGSNNKVDYGYSITAHRSQGSTYGNVLLIESDINHNPNIVERNRIKYTAYTRAKEKLFVL